MENMDTHVRVQRVNNICPPPHPPFPLSSPMLLPPCFHQQVRQQNFLRDQISSPFLDQTTATGTVFPYLKTLLSFCNKCCIHVAKYLFRGHWKINTWDLRRNESSGTVKYSTCNFKIKKVGDMDDTNTTKKW